ncbi:MAG: DUF3108 domain-containing protein [Thiohalorhabdaceae bacterium]
MAVAMLVAGFPGVTVASPSGRGWQGGFERLRYGVQWGYLTVGETILQARSPEAGRAELLSETCTDGAVNGLYQKRDRILAHSRITPSGFRTEAFRTARSRAPEQSGQQYRFSGNGVVYIRDLADGKRDYMPVAKGTLDILTALYAIRGSALEPESRFAIPVLDQGEQHRLKVAVKAKETLDTVLGEATPTFRVRTYLEEEGTGRRRRPMRLWLTAERRHLPVRLEADGPLGPITLELRRIRTTAPSNPQAGLECR